MVLATRKGRNLKLIVKWEESDGQRGSQSVDVIGCTSYPYLILHPVETRMHEIPQKMFESHLSQKKNFRNNAVSLDDAGWSCEMALVESVGRGSSI